MTPGRICTSVIALLLAWAPAVFASANYVAVTEHHVEEEEVAGGVTQHTQVVFIRNDSPCNYKSFAVTLLWMSPNTVVRHSEEVEGKEGLAAGESLRLEFEFRTDDETRAAAYRALTDTENGPLSIVTGAPQLVPDCSQVEGLEWEDVHPWIRFTPALIDQKVGQQEEIQSCFNLALLQESDALAITKFWVGFVIEPTGSTSAVFLKNPDLQGSPLEDCLREQIIGVTWPAFAGQPKTFHFPYLLRKHRKKINPDDWAEEDLLGGEELPWLDD